MRLARTPVVIVAVIGVAVALASPAHAAKPKPTYTVKVGTTTTGTASLTASGSNGYGFFNTTIGGTSLSCSSSKSSMTATLSTTSTGKKIAKVGPTTWSGCYTYDGVPVNVTTKKAWQLNVIGPADSNGLMPLSTAKVTISVVAPGGQCSYLLKGTYGGSYNNSTGVIQLGGSALTLTVSDYVYHFGNCDVDGNGDHITPNGYETVTASSPTGNFTITRN